MTKGSSTAKKFFGRAAFYFTVIDTIAPIVLKHKYIFVSDEWFSEWTKSNDFSVERMNSIIALELVEKAHLAAVSALLRAKRWADAMCLMHDASNFLGWAASLRGLLEAAGDTLDGLCDIPLLLAGYRYPIMSCLAGKENRFVFDNEYAEAKLNHFVHAGWMRTKKGPESTLKAKENATYVALLGTELPDVLDLYRRLCAISHPSNASIEYFYEHDPTPVGEVMLTPMSDSRAISRLHREFPNAPSVALQMNCEPAFLILRVLHRFRVHPQLQVLKKLHWTAIKGWAEIEHHLRDPA